MCCKRHQFCVINAQIFKEFFLLISISVLSISRNELYFISVTTVKIESFLIKCENYFLEIIQVNWFIVQSNLGLLLNEFRVLT